MHLLQQLKSKNNMTSVILIYTTDSHHSMSSMELIAVASTEKKRDTLVRRFLRNYLYEKLTLKEINEAIEQLQQMGQTQGLSKAADLEIYTETYNVNELI